MTALELIVDGIRIPEKAQLLYSNSGNLVAVLQVPQNAIIKWRDYCWRNGERRSMAVRLPDTEDFVSVAGAVSSTGRVALNRL